MKNKYFLMINVALFAIFSIVLFTCNSIFTNSFWIPYVFLIVAFITSTGITSYDLVMEKQRLSKDFIKQLVATVYVSVVGLVNIIYLIVKTESLAWLIIPNALIILFFVVAVLVAHYFKGFVKEQEVELKDSHKFKNTILLLVEDAYMKESNTELKQELFNLKNLVKALTPSTDTSLEGLENEIESNCLKLVSVPSEEKTNVLVDINALIKKRDLLIKENRKNV